MNLTKFSFFTWIFCIISFTFFLTLGTNFFSTTVQNTSFGNSKYFLWLLGSSVVLGVLSFISSIGSLILLIAIKKKCLDKLIIIFLMIIGICCLVYFIFGNKTIISSNSSKINSFNNWSSSKIEIPSNETTAEMKDRVFRLVNEEREKAGLKPLTENKTLELSAINKANDMFAKNYWAHISPEGQTPWVIFGQAGYQFEFAGENLAKAFFSSEDTVKSWMDSPTHRENILKANYTETGIAVIDGSLSNQQTRLIVQHFGKPFVFNTPSAKTNEIVKYHEWCTGKDISIYSNELIVKKSTDGQTYGMTKGDWDCYESFLNGERTPSRAASRTGNIISYHEWCTGKDINIYENELVFRTVNGKGYSMTKGDWDCYDSKNR